MYKEYFQNISDTDNVIISLGDSFTQGVGAYPSEIWKKETNRFFNIHGDKYIDLQYKNSWPSILSNMIEYKVLNLAINGTGNRSAVKELYLSNFLKNHKGNVVVIFMMSGINRFDFIRKDYNSTNHLRWMTIWPLIRKATKVAELEEAYFRHQYSEKFAAIETLLNLAEAELFCKAHGYQFYFASAFDDQINQQTFSKYLGDDQHLLELINWDNFINPLGYNTFMDLLCFLEDDDTLKSTDYQNWCANLTTPSKYLTPCMHWSIDGHKVVAEEIFKILKEKNI
jgi:hypothetical protein